MKIGIFGDSFAEKNFNQTAWWQLLKQHGHDVVCFGEAGSSIGYSAKLLYKTHQNFDFTIWCMTGPGRFSVEIPERDQVFHSTAFIEHTGLAEINQNIIDACQSYLKYVFDPDFENLIGKALANYFLNIVSKLMIIPCFYSPLETNFNLYKLCTRELLQVFSDKEVHKLYQSCSDIRVCHLTKKNNQILAEIIANNLKPGIFSTNYSNFDFENITIDQLVKTK